MADRAYLQRLARELGNQGRLIEVGWLACRIAWVPSNASPEQLEAMCNAYMAGAQHLWASIFAALDPGHEPTEDDYKRMDMIGRELEVWAEQHGQKPTDETRQ